MAVENEFGDVFEELKARGSIHSHTNGADEFLREGHLKNLGPGAPIKSSAINCYTGFDPTSASLHVGSLVPLVNLVRFHRYGHRPVVVIGDATARVGDPSGKDRARPSLNLETIETNADRIEAQIKRFFKNNGVGQKAVSYHRNSQWLDKLPLTDFLGGFGRMVSVNRMLRRESVKRRLERDEFGMSYAEFSYQLIQAFDFFHLAIKSNRKAPDNFWIQAGGSDQWGNMLAGVDLISGLATFSPLIGSANKFSFREAHVLAYPLITNADGTKLGKSEHNAPTINPQVTSPYQLYQFFFNTADADVIRYLKLFTLVSLKEIDQLQKSLENEPHKRETQKRLADEVTRMVHAETGLLQAQSATDALFNEDYAKLSPTQLKDVFKATPATALSSAQLGRISLIDLLSLVDKTVSKAKARQLVASGAVAINGAKITDLKRTIGEQDLLPDSPYMVVRWGRRNHSLVEVSGLTGVKF